MHNIDVNNIVYEDAPTEYVDEVPRFVYMDRVTNEQIFSGPSMLNSDGTVDYASTVEFASEIFKDNAWQEYRNSAMPGQNPAANVYVNGQIKRIDYLITETEAQALIDIIEQRFPAYELEACYLNVIGSYGPYREPYTAESSISFYDIDLNDSGLLNSRSNPDHVPTRLPLAKYNVDYDVYTDMKPWFGYKFNLDDGTVSMKIVHRNQIDTVTYPPMIEDQKETYYARIHNEDGTIDNMNDMFFDAHYEDIQAYCTTHSIPYPLPDTITNPATVMVWGVVFNGTTGVPIMMKGYECRYVEPIQPT